MDIPPFPEFTAVTTTAISLLMAVILKEDDLDVVPLYPAEYIFMAVILVLQVVQRTQIPIHIVIRREEVWPQLAEDPVQFWHVTGETPISLSYVVNRISGDVQRFVRNPRPRIRETRPYALTVRDRVLMLFIWLRSYLTFSHLGMLFGVSEATAVENVHTIFLITIFHYERRYIVWHPHQVWNNMRGTIPEFPDVVGMIDATPIRINRPQGNIQRMYYRRDRGFHFINWQVIIDCNGMFTYGQAGFMGHLTDAASWHMMPQMGHNRPLSLPRNSYVMADTQSAIHFLFHFQGVAAGGLMQLCKYTIGYCLVTECVLNTEFMISKFIAVCQFVLGIDAGGCVLLLTRSWRSQTEDVA